MAMQHDPGETQKPEPERVESPGTTLEQSLEEHVGIRPGEAAVIGHEGSHEPSEHSYWPFMVALSVLIIGIGFLSTIVISAIGAFLLMGSVVGWFTEPWVS